MAIGENSGHCRWMLCSITIRLTALKAFVASTNIHASADST